MSASCSVLASRVRSIWFVIVGKFPLPSLYDWKAPSCLQSTRVFLLGFFALLIEKKFGLVLSCSMK